MKTQAHTTISVIIPVYNEVRTLPSIIEVVLGWGRAREVIVVDDGSTDASVDSIRQFRGRIRVVSFSRNHGKAYAMAKGITSVSGQYVLFLDGDLVGLTAADLDSLVDPLVENIADMTIGVRYTHTNGPQVFKPIGGERCLRRGDLVPIVPHIRHLGYGIELYLNHHFRHGRIRYVDMPYVSILGKLEKQTIPESVASYLKEAVDLVAQITRQQSGTVTPGVRKLYRMTRRYIQQALEYFQ